MCCWPRFKQTYWWILPVQFLLLREEVQTVLQRHLPPRAPLGNGQGQIAEHIEGVGVVWAHWAVQRATQLSREQVCIGKMNTAVRHWNALMEPPSKGPFLTYYSAVISLQVLFPHDSCFLGNPMGQKRQLNWAWFVNLLHQMKNIFSGLHLNLAYFCSGSFTGRRT